LANLDLFTALLVEENLRIVIKENKHIFGQPLGLVLFKHVHEVETYGN
jgi:hypothetical protein